MAARTLVSGASVPALRTLVTAPERTSIFPKSSCVENPADLTVISYCAFAVGLRERSATKVTGISSSPFVAGRVMKATLDGALAVIPPIDVIRTPKG